jgi:hypothetical protein
MGPGAEAGTTAENVAAFAFYSHAFAISPRVSREFCWKLPALFDSEGAGNAGRPMRPPPHVQMAGVGQERTHVSQVTPESPGIPHAMVYGLWRARLGGRFFHRRRSISPPA